MGPAGPQGPQVSEDNNLENKYELNTKFNLRLDYPFNQFSLFTCFSFLSREGAMSYSSHCARDGECSGHVSSTS